MTEYTIAKNLSGIPPWLVHSHTQRKDNAMSAKTLLRAADEQPLRRALVWASADTPQAEQKAAAVRRAEYIVETLSACVVDPAGYRFDRECGARFLENMRKQNW